MPTVDILDVKKTVVGKEDLPESVFAARVKDSYFHDVVRMQMANRRKGTHSTLNKGIMKGGGKKPYRQKGTGRARSGSSISPLGVGGAVTFGPHPRDYSYTVPKKIKKLALKAALTDKLNAQKL